MDALVAGKDATDKFEVSLIAVADVGLDGLAVGLAFSFQLGETAGGRMASDTGQIWVLANCLPVVGWELPLAIQWTTLKLCHSCDDDGH
jgi:hypothetical protein